MYLTEDNFLILVIMDAIKYHYLGNFFPLLLSYKVGAWLSFMVFIGAFFAESIP